MTTSRLVRISLFTSLTAIGAFISIPTGPIYITLQSFFVLLSGIILGPVDGAISQILYVLLGLIGLPIFSGFTGGPQAIFMPSFGFILGFIFSSYTSGILVRKNIQSINSLRFNISFAAICGTIIIYIFGLPYMYYILNLINNQNLSFVSIMNLGFFIFIPGDMIKLILLIFIGARIFPLVK